MPLSSSLPPRARRLVRFWMMLDGKWLEVEHPRGGKGKFVKKGMGQSRAVKGEASRRSRSAMLAFGRPFQAKTKDGVKVKALSTHAEGRILERRVSEEGIRDALQNPIKEPEDRIDDQGQSRRYIGLHATVNLNVEEGLVTTCWPTKRRYRKKYGEGHV
ncbi:MAG: DUF4258 domain-containing protein [Oscillospiraceae bacterium]|nr:DUF4258 domain-containing protein [Oscillospiraceae bacterium]